MKILLIAVLLFSFSACGGGNGENGIEAPPEPEALMPFEGIIGSWLVRLDAPFTSCRAMDLWMFVGEGFLQELEFTGEEKGSFQYITIHSEEASVEYRVTDNGDPFKMEREFNVRTDECHWTIMQSYELSFLSDDILVGKRWTVYTSSGFCEECYYTLQVEMNRRQ